MKFVEAKEMVNMTTPDNVAHKQRLRQSVPHVFDLARQHAHNVDGVADHVSWAALAFRTGWHDAPQK
jgi:hypothetical protein